MHSQAFLQKIPIYLIEQLAIHGIKSTRKAGINPVTEKKNLISHSRKLESYVKK